jgi:hypothetical protein
VVKGELSKRQKQYLEEDKTVAREERREMPKEDLDEWLLEDYDGASEWITKRTLRRHEEEKGLWSEIEYKHKAEAILDKQLDSAQRTYVKHPELKISERQEQLVKEGKSKEEVLRIICQENPKYAKCVEIYKENPSKYLASENGPELVVEEMERRINKPSTPDMDALRKELAEARAEVSRLKNLDSGITSTHQAEPKTPETDIEKKQAELARKVGLDPERLKKRVATRVAQGFDV